MSGEENKWLKKAREDFSTAKFNIEGGKIEAGIFFLQQSAEKALKAVYIKKNKDMIRTHDLVMLSRKVNAPEKILNYSKEINPAYQYTRYPDVPTVEEGLEDLAKKFILYVEEILKWVNKNI